MGLSLSGIGRNTIYFGFEWLVVPTTQTRFLDGLDCEERSDECDHLCSGRELLIQPLRESFLFALLSKHDKKNILKDIYAAIDGG